MNKFSACLVALLTFILVGVFAYMFRYEHLTGVYRVDDFVPVWDRWGQRICTVHFGSKGVACSPDALGKLAPSPSTFQELAPIPPQDQFQKLRSAGFSEQEISDYVKQQQSKPDK
jgi:hypothetical protein